MKQDYKILLQAKKDSLEYLQNKEHEEDETIAKILQEINQG